MAEREHRYHVTVEWTGNLGAGTANYRAYSRDHVIKAGDKPAIPGSSDPNFRGDPRRWNPEELFVASLSACHKLWYLHLAAVSGVTVIRYEDAAEGVMIESGDAGGRFAKVVLRPSVTIAAGGDADLALRLHDDAHAKCFIANSVNCAVEHAPTIHVEVRDAAGSR